MAPRAGYFRGYQNPGVNEAIGNIFRVQGQYEKNEKLRREFMKTRGNYDPIRVENLFRAQKQAEQRIRSAGADLKTVQRTLKGGVPMSYDAYRHALTYVSPKGRFPRPHHTETFVGLQPAKQQLKQMKGLLPTTWGTERDRLKSYIRLYQNKVIPRAEHAVERAANRWAAPYLAQQRRYMSEQQRYVGQATSASRRLKGQQKAYNVYARALQRFQRRFFSVTELQKAPPSAPPKWPL